jgi:hypothetical protein
MSIFTKLSVCFNLRKCAETSGKMLKSAKSWKYVLKPEKAN